MAERMKKELILEGLDCASCAVKIEEHVKQMNGVAAASVNFATKTLTLEVREGGNLDNILSSTHRAVKKLEPDVVVKEKREGGTEFTDGTGTKQSEVVREPPYLTKRVAFGVGAALFIAGLLYTLPFWAELSLFLVSYLLLGGSILLKAVKNILRGHLFDENFLMAIATLGAFAMKEFSEGVAVMLFYRVGEFFQDLAVNRSRKSIAALMDIRPDYANLVIGEEMKKVEPSRVRIGDRIMVKPGEKVPLDGEVVEGRSMLDTSALTGESVPREAKAGSEILSGCVNLNGALTVQVTKTFAESTVSKILDLVENAGSKKAPTENFITHFAKYYTPAVVFSAAALAFIPPLLLPGATFAEWVHRALIFLVVSCPCALVISIPLGFFGGIGAASKSGILVKGGNFLEALHNVETVVFDKTGTLTKGVFKVTQMKASGSLTEEALLEYAAYAESRSNHPIAISIRHAYGKEIDQRDISDYEEIPGHGVKGIVRGRKVIAGNDALMRKEKIPFAEVDTAGSVVHLAIDGIYSGYILISDELKVDSREAIKGLKRIGIRRLVMLTGDREAVAEQTAKEIGIDEVHAGLLPYQKVEQVERLLKQASPKGKLVFMGDGINDAPVLARADIGVAMGGVGSDAAIESADVVIMTDEPSKLATAIHIAKRTRQIVWQNIFFALAVKGVVLLLGAGGIATMWEAVFADVGVSVLAVFNAMRVMRVYRGKKVLS